MPCAAMMELEAICEKYIERRDTAIFPERESRRSATGSHRLGQFRCAFLMQAHRRDCAECRQV
jgi:hypothetical protein